MKFGAKVSAVFIGVAVSTSSFSQDVSYMELLDTTLQEVYSLHQLSTTSKSESKVANGRRDYGLGGRLRGISGQANGVAGSLYNRLVPALSRKAIIQDIKRDFANFSRFDIANLTRSIQGISGDVGIDYPGSVITFTGAHENLTQMLNEAIGNPIADERGWICAANDNGVEEHPMGHAAVAPDRESAMQYATQQCLSLHGGCKVVRCSEIK